MNSVLIGALVVLAVLVGILSLRHYRLKLQFLKMKQTLEDIQLGSLNQRFRLQSLNPLLNEICGGLNRLLDQFQNTSEKAYYLENSRKKMLSNISHDLQTHLTAILGYVEALQSDSSITAVERARYLVIIADKGARLSRLLRDFFELSKLESDDTKVKLQKMNLPEMIVDVLSTFYQEFEKVSIIPMINIPAQPLFVWAEPGLVERLMNNLVSNALRYGSSGGEIGIVVREEEFLVWIDVWDRGQGIKPSDLPHVFERLYTGAASRNPKLQGNGLGLTIAKQLAEKMQGEIHVTSVPNEKTTFSFSLSKCPS